MSSLKSNNSWRFDINWLENNDSERRNLFHILETFGLVQRIDYPTYQNGHLLDYVITRRDSEIFRLLPKFLITWHYMSH